MNGPGDKNPEEQVEELINDESVNTEELSRGTEVYEEEAEPEEEEEVRELEFEDDSDDFEDSEVLPAYDEDTSNDESF